MSTTCKILFSVGITITLLNAGYNIIESYYTGNFSLMHFSSGLGAGILIAFGIKTILKKTGFLSR